MADYIIDGAILTDIADAVREKTGGTEPIVPENMAEEVSVGFERAYAAGYEDGKGGWIGDGNTHIWISLSEGRTSPMMGLNLNGTVTVDWGDGTEPEVLTHTNYYRADSLTHNYAAAGNYMITISGDGELRIAGDGVSGSYLLRYNPNVVDDRNTAYVSSICKVEVGNNVTSLNQAFRGCRSLSGVSIPNNRITVINTSTFQYCSALRSVTLPDGVTSIVESMFYLCYALASVTIPESVTSIGDSAFYECSSLTSIKFPAGVTSIGRAVFYNCYGVRTYDFTACTAVPTLAATNAFYNIPADCEIRVPAALYDEWIAATNWSAYVDRIVAV